MCKLSGRIVEVRSTPTHISGKCVCRGAACALEKQS